MILPQLTAKQWIEIFTKPEHKSYFVDGAKVLAKELKNNGYSITIGNAIIFTDLIEDEDTNMCNYYRLCILYLKTE